MNFYERCRQLVADLVEECGPGIDVQIEFEELEARYPGSPENPVWSDFYFALTH